MMALSGEALNYSGSFIVFRNGEISTLKVSHMGSAQGGVKKISSVDGQQREIVSSQDAVSCLLPDLNYGCKGSSSVYNRPIFSNEFQWQYELAR